jgi:acyl-homoserine lactone acylase PvdQ
LNAFNFHFVCVQRLWQIEFQRRLGSGRLCEVVGDGAFDIDKLMRTLGVHDAAVRAYATLDQDSKDVLQAYVGGINAYLDTQPRLPLEFVIFNFRPHPWVPTDVVCACVRLPIAFQFRFACLIEYHFRLFGPRSWRSHCR